MQPFQPFSRSCSFALGFRALGWRSLLGAKAPSGDMHPWVTPLAAGLPAGAALLGLGMRVPDTAGDLHTLQDDHHIGRTANGGYSPRCLAAESKEVTNSRRRRGARQPSALGGLMYIREAPELFKVLAAGTESWGFWRAQL